MVAKTQTALTPAVAYIRMSSLKQDASPEQQRQEADKLAATNKCRIIREYADEGISGDNAKRPGFQQMLRDAVEKRDFAAIICWDQDRFARFDSIKAGKYIDPLREAGVWLITKAQGVVDWNTFTGRMMYSIIQEGKHQYLLDLSRNVLRGRIASARKGQLIVQPAYGYDRVFYDDAGRLARRVPYGEKFNRPKGWTVKIEPSDDGEKVATVKWIMQTFADGDCSIRWIAKSLNERGVPAPRGRGWNANTVRYILAHRVYLGQKAFGERRGGKYHQIGDDGEIQAANGTANRRAPSWPTSPTRPSLTRLHSSGFRPSWQSGRPPAPSREPAITSCGACCVVGTAAAQCAGRSPPRGRAADTTVARAQTMADARSTQFGKSRSRATFSVSSIGGYSLPRTSKRSRRQFTGWKSPRVAFKGPQRAYRRRSPPSTER